MKNTPTVPFAHVMLNWPRIQFSGITGPASVHSPTSFLSSRISACRCSVGASRKKFMAAICFASASSQRFHRFRMWSRISVCSGVGGSSRLRNPPVLSIASHAWLIGSDGPEYVSVAIANMPTP